MAKLWIQQDPVVCSVTRIIEGRLEASYWCRKPVEETTWDFVGVNEHCCSLSDL